MTPAVEQGGEQATEKPLAYRAVRGGLWVAASSYFVTGFGFVATLALTHLLDPEDFGVVALAGSMFAFFNLRTKTGVGYAFAQRQTTSVDLLGTHLTLELVAGLGTLLLASLLMPLLRALGYSTDVVTVLFAFAIIGIADSILSTATVLLDKELRFAPYSAVIFFAFPLSYAPAFWLALHGGRYWSLVAQSATYSLLLLALLWWMARRVLPGYFRARWRFDRPTAASLLRFGGVVGLSVLASMIVTQFDTFLVGTIVGLVTVGFYDRAYRIAQWPNQLITAVISRAAFFTYSRLQGDAARLEKTVTMTIWVITTLALPLAVGIFVAAPDLVRLLYGERWLPSAVFLRFLVVYSVLRPLLDDAGGLFVAVGRPRLTLNIAAAEAGTLIVAGTALTLTFGALGTCVAVGLTFVVGLALTYRYVISVVALRLWGVLGLPAVATVLAFAAYLLLTRLVDVQSLPLIARVIGKFSFACLSYFAIMLALQPKATFDRVSYVRKLILAR